MQTYSWVEVGLGAVWYAGRLTGLFYVWYALDPYYYQLLSPK